MSPELELKRARDRFEYGDYQDAAQLARRMLDDGRLASEEQLVEAYRVLGLSYYYLQRPQEARSAFVSLLSVEPDFRLDPFFHPPKVVEFFDQVKAENGALLAPLREQKRRVAEERRRQDEARRRLLDEEARRREELAQSAEVEPRIIERTISNHEYLVNWVPFGAGQFQNGELVKGGLFAAGQAVTGLASAVGFVVVANLQRCEEVVLPIASPGDKETRTMRCGVPAESMNLAKNMDRVKWVAGGLFWALVAYGIVDAHLAFQPFVIISPPASPPGTPAAPRAALAPTLRIAPWGGPDGAGALLSLTF